MSARFSCCMVTIFFVINYKVSFWKDTLRLCKYPFLIILPTNLRFADHSAWNTYCSGICQMVIFYYHPFYIYLNFTESFPFTLIFLFNYIMGIYFILCYNPLLSLFCCTNDLKFSLWEAFQAGSCALPLFKCVLLLCECWLTLAVHFCIYKIFWWKSMPADSLNNLSLVLFR